MVGPLLGHHGVDVMPTHRVARIVLLVGAMTMGMQVVVVSRGWLLLLKKNFCRHVLDLNEGSDSVVRI